MKRNRRRTALLALLLAAAVFCGSGALGTGFATRADAESVERQSAVDIVPFDRMEYQRPDLNVLRAHVAAVKLALVNGDKYRTVTGFLDACYADYYRFQTMYNLAYIRSCQDVTDAYYAREYDWCEEQYSTVSQIMEEMFSICGSSAMASRLERSYFWEGFQEEYGDGYETTFDDELVALMQKESNLLARYRALAADTLGEDDEGAYEMFAADYEQEDWEESVSELRRLNRPLGRIFIDLVKTRQELARKLDYDSYEQMQYAYTYERDYSPADAHAYMEDIRTYVVPLYREVMATDPYATVDYGYLSEKRLHRILSSGAARMGGEIQESFSFMQDYDLYDTEVSGVKAATSFQSYLDDYEAPFLFLDPYGDMEDVLTFSHEFGHYTDAYINYNASETIDVAETFSQAMEYLMLGYLDEALKPEEVENLYRMKMLDTLELYVQQASFTAFESAVYAADPEKLTVEMLNDLALRMAEEYGYCSPGEEEFYSLVWTSVNHFFETPFYSIAYPVSNDIAMQIYEREQREPGAGLATYLEILPRQSGGLVDTALAGGLESPFAPGRIAHVAQDLRQRLFNQAV
ncbi:MAG: hypothetical protein J5927_05910 [Oscillospiraceae bacterium]|nr:hypothetical protein [Oscillospiraceae bacterium]